MNLKIFKTIVKIYLFFPDAVYVRFSSFPSDFKDTCKYLKIRTGKDWEEIAPSWRKENSSYGTILFKPTDMPGYNRS
jgi:hypothetical protein